MLAWYKFTFAGETMNIPEALSTKEASQLLKLSEQRVRTLLRTGELSGRQIGKNWITSREAIETYSNNGVDGFPQDRPRGKAPLPTIKALSFFSGAMGLDLGLEHAGIPVLLACEMDKACRRTIVANRPDIGLIGNILDYSAEEILQYAGLKSKDKVDLMVGGPPCQPFSTAGSRKGFQDERGDAFTQYIKLILEIKPKYAVIENVRGLLSAAIKHTPHSERTKDWNPALEEKKGGALLSVLEMLRAGGYQVSFNLYNSANFGVPQSRERVVILCSSDGKKLPYLTPTHSMDAEFKLPKWRTLKECFKGLSKKNCEYVQFPEKRLKFYRMLSEGQYWKDLPESVLEEAMGKSLFSGGGKTGFYRRLAWNKPSCTLVTSPNMPATDICHPNEDRPLSIQEYMRIQQFPDDWIVCGSLEDRYKQIGNAVPVGLGEAIGRVILARMAKKDMPPPAGFRFSRYSNTDEVSWEASTKLTLGLLQNSSQLEIF
jgi:DNA (cytosine-5)-methyltransferase 1